VAQPSVLATTTTITLAFLGALNHAAIRKVCHREQSSATGKANASLRRGTRRSALLLLPDRHISSFCLIRAWVYASFPLRPTLAGIHGPLRFRFPCAVCTPSTILSGQPLSSP